MAQGNEAVKGGFPIVGIGASAGGIEALTQLLRRLPAAPGMAFLLVQHRDPAHASLLAEVLSKPSHIPLIDAEDGTVVEVNHGYVVPANATLSITDGMLRLRRFDSAKERRAPIDAMFSSLATTRGSNSIGVVLSGTGSDGTIGIQEIKVAGGITFAQDPASARFDGMPKKAIATGCVDFILGPAAIADKLLEIERHPYLRRDPNESGNRSASDEHHLRQILQLLRAQVRVDFSQYKRNTLQRRLERRMVLRQVGNLAEYAQLLREDHNEIAALVQDFLIRVTRFFRDPEEFRGLTEVVFPRFLENRSRPESIRIWVPGCATGEEAYSIAILLTEFFGDGARALPVQIFGTDLSDTAIQHARAGKYASTIEGEVSSDRLQRFFVKQDDEHYIVGKSIRDICIFARHDLTYDPPFSRIDLVCCRNVLIYFDLTLQRKVIKSFHYALRSGGFLVLGPSESISDGPLFKLIDAQQRIYRKQSVPGQTAPESNSIELNAQLPAISETIAPALPIAAGLPRAQREIERLLLTRYAPASLLIDEHLDIIYFHGNTAPYLQHASGGASLNLQKVILPALLMEVSSIIEQARVRNAPVRRKHVRFEISESLAAVDIEVVPLKLLDLETVLFAVIFESATLPSPRHFSERFSRWWSEAFRSEGRVAGLDKDQRIQQLQQEIEATREYLRNAIEEHQAAQEQLKSAHEEALSASEEFQSTNEELETAKEELQTTNEELTTTNEELRDRNRALNELNEALRISRDHLSAIFETLREPLVVLDSKLAVQEANAAFYETFGTRPADTEKRLLYELNQGRWNLPSVRRLIEEVLSKESHVRDFEMTHTFPRIGTRTMLLNARRLLGNGNILLAIEDITERTQAEALTEANRQKDQFLAMLSHELRNPLASIANALRIIHLQGYEDPTQERARVIIERQVGQLTRLIADLLDVSRITTGAILLHRENVTLNVLIDRAVETTRPLINERQHELSVSVPSEAVWLYADATRLEQVLINLLTNAAKYMDPAGHIWLTVERNENEVIIRVRDTGFGIDAALLPNIFRIFTQSQQTLARAQGGLGVGLSVAQHLVELHGGNIEAFSEGIGKGSEFVVRLPINYSLGANVESVVNEAEQAPRNSIKRALVVDDNEDATETMAMILTAQNLEVRVAHTGTEALRIASNFAPDAILLDIGLPEMDGYEVARRLREDPKFRGTLLIAVSGYGQAEDLKRSREAGFDVHLVKPINLNKLNEVLSVKLQPN